MEDSRPAETGAGTVPVQGAARAGCASGDRQPDHRPRQRTAVIRGQRLDAGPPAMRFAFGYWEDYHGRHDEHKLLMPYCEQVAGSCWATDTMLMLRPG